MEDLCAVREQRRAAFGQVQPSLIQFGQVSDEQRRHVTFALGEVSHPSEKRVVRELSHRTEQLRIHGLL